MKRFYFILYLVSSAVWSQVDCSLPTYHGVALNFDATFNALSGNYMATDSISSTDEIASTNYLSPEITLNEGFRATAGTSVLISNAVCGSGIDLYVRDNLTDLGQEPSVGFFADSPDIWVRNSNNVTAIHENPIYGQLNFINVRVTNRGTMASTGLETLTVHWAPAPFLQAPKCGSKLFDDYCKSFDTKTIGVVQPGASIIVTFTFEPLYNSFLSNNPYVYTVDYNLNSNYALQATVNNGELLSRLPFPSTIFWIENNRGLALKTTPVLGVSTLSGPKNAIVENIDLHQDILLAGSELDTPAMYYWYDSQGNLVYQGKDLFIDDAIAEKYQLKVFSPSDGYFEITDYDLKYNPNRLEVLYPNPASSSNLNVKYKVNEANSAYIMITSYYMTNGISNNYIINKDDTEINIDLSSYPNGIYKVILVTDGTVVGMKNLSKQ